MGRIVFEREARQAALEDARHHAGIQAEVLGINLGDIVASVDVVDPYLTGITSPSGCDSDLVRGGYFDPSLGATLPPFDPTRDSAEVEVYHTVRVTFAIAGDTATPAA